MIKPLENHNVKRGFGSNGGFSRIFSLSSFGGEGWGEEAHCERREPDLETTDARSRGYGAFRSGAKMVMASSPLPSPPKEERRNHRTVWS